jgi:hypothetical protein
MPHSGWPAAVLTVIVHAVERGNSCLLASHAGRCRGGRDGEIMASFDDNMLLSDRLRMACRQCRACQTLQPTTTRVNFLLLYSRYGGKTPDGYARWLFLPLRYAPSVAARPNGAWHWDTFLQISLISDVALPRMGSDECLMAMMRLCSAWPCAALATLVSFALYQVPPNYFQCLRRQAPALVTMI